MRRFLSIATIALMNIHPAVGQAGQAAPTGSRIRAAVPIKAYAFDMTDVRLLDGPFKHAMDVNGRYLLSLEADRLLSGFRTQAGLEPKGRVYGGWEEMGIAGHSLGHYLSACALMYAQTGDERFAERVNYIVDELAVCQDAHGDGYVAAIPRGREIFDEVARGDIRTKGFDLNGCWVPIYTLHKQMAGLIDAYRLCGNDRAVEVARGLGDYLAGKLGGLTDEQMQLLLNCEHGGINEALADLYAVTGDQKYLNLSRRIYHKAILDPLAEQRDDLAGKHSNTQVPKVIGMARLYELTGEQRYVTLAKFFWRTVVANHTYVNGGNSAWEYFGPPGKLSERLGDTTETCNTYNMLKLTRHLFSWSPQAEYADYYERALYNHILAHQHPETGMFVYKGFLDPGTRKNYSGPFDSFWCCVGTGMENHAKYGDSIYFHDGDGLFVSLFIASKLTWKDKGVVVVQETDYPAADTTKLTIHCDKPVGMAVRIRHPYWATDGMTVRVNGKTQGGDGKPGSFAEVVRMWADGDVLEATLPMQVRTEAMPDNADRLALMYGPLVLCGELADGAEISVLVPGDKDLTACVEPVADRPLEWMTKGLGRPDDLRLIPLHAMHDRRYNVYFDRFSREQWAARQAEYEAQRRREAELEARTVDVLRIGQMQPERDHNLTGENTGAGTFADEHWRHATDGGWFAFEMKVDREQPVDLVVRYWGSDAGGRVFDILIDGTTLATERLERNKPGQFYDQTYPIPAEWTAGKDKVVVKFAAQPGGTAGGVFGCRVVRRE